MKNRSKIFLTLFTLLTFLFVSSISSSAATPSADDGQVYVVQASDWLSKIADKYYGDMFAWKTIWEATNEKAKEDSSFTTIADPNFIDVGQKLWIPGATTVTPAPDDSTESSEGSTEETTETPSENVVLKLRILETTDIHTYIVNYDYYRDQPDEAVGLANVATLIKQARTEVENTILVDNGDLLQGNPLGDYIVDQGLEENIHPAYKAMNLLDYVANIGNHEFNYGLDFLNASIAGADFPYINANIYHDGTDEHYFTPYIIEEKTFVDESGNEQTIDVGFIGFAPPQIMNWDKGNLEGIVTVSDIVETAEKYIPMMEEEGADLIITIPHSGFSMEPAEGMDANAVYYLSTVPGIDAILFGHSHVVFPGPEFEDLENIDNEKGTINGVPAVEAGYWGNHLGIIDLTLENVDGTWQVVDSQSEARPVSKREDRKTISLVDADASIIAAVQEDHEGTLSWIREPFGETLAPIHSFFALVQDDPSIQIVTNSQTWYFETQVQGTEYEGIPILSAGAPFKAGRGGPEDFTDVPTGEVAFKNVADLYIYPNTLKAVLLTGSQVQEWLERSAGQFNQIDPDSTDEQPLINPDFPTYNFDVIDGVTYQIDVTELAKYDKGGEVVNPDANRIKNLMYDGNPIEMDGQYIVVTNNYRASGGGNFPEITSDKIIFDAPDENREVLANFIAEQGKFNPSADGNWSFAPINDTVNVVFRTSPSETTAKLAEAIPQITPTGTTNEDGYAMYKIDLSE